jgi:hypothetical protein
MDLASQHLWFGQGKVTISLSVMWRCKYIAVEDTGRCGVVMQLSAEFAGRRIDHRLRRGIGVNVECSTFCD